MKSDFLQIHLFKAKLRKCKSITAREIFKKGTEKEYKSLLVQQLSMFE